MKGLAHIGALEVLHEKGLLGAVKEYIGISAGALCAFALCIGCSLTELRMVVELLEFGNLRDVEPESVLEFPETFGVDTGENLMRLVTAILRAKHLPPEITFAELRLQRPTAPCLRMYATDLNTCRSAELSAAATPNMEVRLGLKASMAIPCYFQPVLDPVTGHLLVDGGVVCHSPLKFLTADEIDTTLSITFCDEHKPKERIETLAAFFKQLYYALDFQYNAELTGSNMERVIFLRCSQFNSLDFEMSHEDKVALLAAGREGAERFLVEWALRLREHKRLPPRRYSVG
jgi:predicted acylesterase/phospholipase RssA